MEDELKRYIYEIALDYKIELSADQLDLYGTYLDELSVWNRRINLTGPTESKRIINELLLDSLIPTPYLQGKGNMLDIGSGAGFPGLVIKIFYPELELSLLEPRSKKVSFLKHVIRILNLEDITVINNRFEDAMDEIKGTKYHLITSRALAGLDKVITLCSPFIDRNGFLIGFLGSKFEEELDKCKEVVKKNSLTIDDSVSYILPEKKFKRNIVLLRKRA